MLQSKRYIISKRVSIISGVFNALLAIIKLVIGFLGQSAALVADGFHSFSDLLSDGLVIIAAKAGSRGPDDDHPYGHRRIETFATIIIALLLLLMAAGIIYRMISNLLLHASLTQPSFFVLIAALLSIAINELLFRYNLSAGKKIHSKLLIANAWHNRSDAFSSLITLLAAGGAFLGIRILDPIGAIIIAIFIIKMGVKMTYHSVNELIDGAVEPQKLSQLQTTINQCPGVRTAHQIRTRLHGSNVLVDCHILVAPNISVSEGHFIGDHVKSQLMKQHNEVTDVTVHIDSEDDSESLRSFHLPHREAIFADLNRLCCHLLGADQILEIRLHYLNEAIQVEITLPVKLLEQQQANELQQQYNEATKTLDAIESITLLFTP